MTNGFLQVPPDSTGKKIFTQEHILGPNTTQVQVFHQADALNPQYLQRIDYRGAATVRFSEGSPLSDSHGNLKVSQSKSIGSYDFVYDDAADLFTDATLTGGTVTWSDTTHMITLGVTNASGSYASRASDKYHYYLPGENNLIALTVGLSDSYQDGCERRWGAFDSNDGCYFDLDDLGVLKVSVRSSTSGSIIKAQVTRSNWNGDKLDGTGPSGFTLDLTKINIYWIDFQLGTGRVRYGVVNEMGDRVVCHTFTNANTSVLPHMRTAALPIQVNIENKRITAGASSIKLVAATVKAEGTQQYTYWRYSNDLPTKVINTSNTYCIALKAKNIIGFNDHNGIGVYPDLLNVFVSGGSVRLDVYWDFMTLTSPTWLLDNGSAIVADTGGVLILTGDEFKPVTFYVDAGSHNLDLSKYFEEWDIGLTSRYDHSTPQNIIVVASPLSGTPTLLGTISYKELR